MTTNLARTFWTTATLVAFAFAPSVLVGCKVNPANPKLAETKDGAPCNTPDAMIADGEKNNNQVNVIGGRGGYLYTFSDMLGTEIWPTAGAKGGTFEMSPGGAENTPYAMRFKGKVVVSDSPVQGGMGMNFLDPKDAYDASQYGGISFWAKVGPGSTTKVRLKIPDARTDPDAGICSECFNDFGMDLNLTTEWQHYIVPFNKLTQLPGWGKPRAFSVDKSRLFGVQFQVNDQTKAYDVWVDQVRFTGCAQ